LFEVVGVHNYGESLFGVDAGGGADETFQGMFRFFEAAFADEMPWRLGCEEKDGEEERWPCPLNCSDEVSLCK
jgi:hypothetical protein